MLDVWEPSYLLYGPDLTRRVVYLPADDALTAAYREGVPRVVITTGDGSYAIDAFRGCGLEDRVARRLLAARDRPEGRRARLRLTLRGLPTPSSAIVQCGLCATSHGWPSGSTKTPE